MDQPDALDSSAAFAAEIPVRFHQQPTPPVAENRRCRICHGKEGEGMLSACGCLGSRRWVHLRCLSAWIQSKVELYNRQTVQCELCGIAYNYELVTVRFLDCQQLKINFTHRRCSLLAWTFFLAVIILSLFSFVGLLVAAGRGVERASQLLPNASVVAYVCSVVIAVIVLSILLIIFVNEYLVRKETKVAVRDCLQAKQMRHRMSLATPEPKKPRVMKTYSLADAI
jgi:hypothetical protein